MTEQEELSQRQLDRECRIECAKITAAAQVAYAQTMVECLRDVMRAVDEIATTALEGLRLVPASEAPASTKPDAEPHAFTCPDCAGHGFVETRHGGGVACASVTDDGQGCGWRGRSEDHVHYEAA